LSDPSRNHEVPEGHFPAAAQVVLLVDRYSAYKAMAQVHEGQVLLAFCWAHVRRDFVKVGKVWPERKNWALDWLHRSCRTTLESLQEHWQGLTRFLDDRRIPLDNNSSERQVRRPALGRKNYYGSGALWSGLLAAMLFSLEHVPGNTDRNGLRP
jgi:transposase